MSACASNLRSEAERTRNFFVVSSLLEFEPAGGSLRSPGGNPRNFEGKVRRSIESGPIDSFSPELYPLRRDARFVRPLDNQRIIIAMCGSCFLLPYTVAFRDFKKILVRCLILNFYL